MKTTRWIAVSAALIMGAGLACKGEDVFDEPVVDETTLDLLPQLDDNVVEPVPQIPSSAAVDAQLKSLEGEVANLLEKVREDDDLKDIFGPRVTDLQNKVEDARVEMDGLKRSHKPVNQYIQRSLKDSVAQMRVRLEQIKDRVDA